MVKPTVPPPSATWTSLTNPSDTISRPRSGSRTPRSASRTSFSVTVATLSPRPRDFRRVRPLGQIHGRVVNDAVRVRRRFQHAHRLRGVGGPRRRAPSTPAAAHYRRQHAGQRQPHHDSTPDPHTFLHSVVATRRGPRGPRPVVGWCAPGEPFSKRC